MTSASQRAFNPLDILARLSWGESDDLELKSAKGGLPASLWETYSAMANMQGGVILLGVEDNGVVTGIRNIEAIRKSFWDTINNRGKVNINLLDSNDVQEVAHPKGLLLAIRVPRATRHQGPVFIGQNPLTGTYRRNADGDYRCNEQEVGRMLADRSQESAHPWLDVDDKGLLTKLNGWRTCRSSGLKGITVAGLLMFGKEEALREALPQYHIDFREKLSKDPSVRWTDRLTMDGTWSGNLYQFYIRVMQKLSADLKLPFQLDAEFFRKGETVVHVAIREALVNALIHADYQGLGGVVIEKYPDRFEFSNPGSLLISIDQILYSNISECRNKSLQSMFTMIGAAEKAGSGVDKIRIGWSSQHWRSPMVKEQVQPNRVLWTLPMVSLIPDESLARLKNRFGTKFSSFNRWEIQALVTADIEKHVDNSRLRQITNKHATDITKLLQDLVSQGALIQDRQGRWSRYYLPPVVGSVHMEGGSVHMEGGASMDRVALLLIAEPARKNRKLHPTEMERVILRLCQDAWLTRRQLADLLDRSIDGLRSRFLTQMVSHGLLQLRFPDKPNRADQAYLAVPPKNQ